jgi:hypothetical protein
MNEASVLKGSRIAQIVHENGLPVINLTQSVSGWGWKACESPDAEKPTYGHEQTFHCRVEQTWNSSSKYFIEEEVDSEIKPYCKYRLVTRIILFGATHQVPPCTQVEEWYSVMLCCVWKFNCWWCIYTWYE